LFSWNEEEEEEEEELGGGCNFAEHPQHRTTTTTLSTRSSPSSSRRRFCRISVSLSYLRGAKCSSDEKTQFFPAQKDTNVFALVFFSAAAFAFFLAPHDFDEQRFSLFFLFFFFDSER